MKRRNFLQKAALGSVGITALGSSLAATAATSKTAKDKQDALASNSLLPVVIATWSVKQATKTAWQAMEDGSSALDAVIAGCGVEEANALPYQGALQDPQIAPGHLPPLHRNQQLPRLKR